MLLCLLFTLSTSNLLTCQLVNSSTLKNLFTHHLAPHAENRKYILRKFTENNRFFLRKDLAL